MHTQSHGHPMPLQPSSRWPACLAAATFLVSGVPACKKKDSNDSPDHQGKPANPAAAGPAAAGSGTTSKPPLPTLSDALDACNKQGRRAHGMEFTLGNIDDGLQTSPIRFRSSGGRLYLSLVAAKQPSPTFTNGVSAIAALRLRITPRDFEHRYRLEHCFDPRTHAEIAMSPHFGDAADRVLIAVPVSPRWKGPATATLTFSYDPAPRKAQASLPLKKIDDRTFAISSAELEELPAAPTLDAGIIDGGRGRSADAGDAPNTSGHSNNDAAPRPQHDVPRAEADGGI